MGSVHRTFLRLALLAAYPACSYPPEFKGQVDVLGYLAKGTLTGSSIYFFPHGQGPRLRVRDASPHALDALEARFVSDRTSAQERLEIVQTSTIKGGWLLDLKAPSTEGDADRGRLDLIGEAVSVVWTRATSEWPRVNRNQGSEAALRSIDSNGTMSLERMAARSRIARLVREREGPSAYVAFKSETASLAASLGLWSVASDALSAAAFVEQDARRFDKVWPLLERARAAASKVNDERGQARTLLVEGYANSELGRHEKAADTFRRASAMAEAIGMYDLRTFAERGVANRLRELGQFRAARRTLLNLRGYIETTASEYERMIWLNDLGWLETHALESKEAWASYEAANRYLASAVALGMALERHDATANSLSNRIYLDYLAGRREEVRAHLKALEQVPHADDSYGRLVADLVAASLEIKPNPGRAAGLFKALHIRSLDESAGEGSEYTWRSLLGLAESYEAMGALVKASSAYTDAIDALENSTRHASLRSTRASFLDDRARLFDRAAALFRRRGKAWDSFRVLERKRGQLFSGLDLQLSKQRLGVDAAERAEALRIRYLNLRDRLEGRGRKRQTVPPDQVEDFDQETAAIRDQVFSGAKSYFDFLDEVAPNRGTGVLDRTALTTALARQRSMIVAPERSEQGWLVHVVTARSVRALTVDTLEKLPLSFRGTQHVFLVPSESVSVPDLIALFPQILPRATASILPWSQLLTRAPDRPDRESPRALVVGDSRSDLPYARKEAGAVAEQLQAETTLLGPAATLKKLLPALHAHHHFHFSGHGLLSAADPWESRLALARDKAFTLEALLLVDHSVERVVLSGCETGKQVRLSDRYAIGLPEAWLLTGARSVVATTRAIDDQAALDYMKRFYAAGGADNPDAAYRSVALAMGEAEPFWKLFYVESLGPPPLTGRAVSR